MMGTRSRWVLAALAAIAGVFLLRGPKEVVSADEAHRLVARGARLIDVRSPEEYAAGHLPSAENIPVSELEGRLHELSSKQQPIVVYCRSGARSARAAHLLERAGYESIADLGAMSRWR